ncbi:Mpo1-like protein [Pseudomonas sp. GWSMS-1]|uniref:Mpo1-like protein n=1 Tax=Pseudomonas sp. GWSMS-1 TaxID=3308997 RepID=UPI003CF63E16
MTHETHETHEHFTSFAEFYPYYLQEHSNSTCRRLHFIGTTLVLTLLAYVVVTGALGLLIALPFVGYGFAWVGHFFFEHNKPATFRYPRWSLMGDFVMFKDMLTGRVAF